MLVTSVQQVSSWPQCTRWPPAHQDHHISRAQSWSQKSAKGVESQGGALGAQSQMARQNFLQHPGWTVEVENHSLRCLPQQHKSLPSLEIDHPEQELPQEVCKAGWVVVASHQAGRFRHAIPSGLTESHHISPSKVLILESGQPNFQTQPREKKRFSYAKRL